MDNVIRLGTARATPGHKAWGQLLVREGRQQVQLPVAVVNGRASGNHVVVIANQHGGEINGVESVRRFVEAVDPRRLCGTVFAVPSANPRAALLLNECWPEGKDESLIAKFRDCPYLKSGQNRNNCSFNMNRKWPGRKGGLLVERMVYEIWQQAVMAPHRKAALLIDFHCHSGNSAIYAVNPPDVELGVATGIATVIHTRQTPESAARNYCTNACRKAGIFCITAELGGQRALDADSIEDGRRAVFNLLKFLGMLDGRLELPPETLIMDPWRNDIVKQKWPGPSWLPYKACHAGLVLVPGAKCFHKHAYRIVHRGEIICEILDPHTGQIVEKCRAPMSGALLHLRGLLKPACLVGDVIFAVCIGRRVRTTAYVRKLNAADYRAA